MSEREVVLDLTGADCPTCIYTIEHAGRKLRGVREIHVDAARHEIRVAYDGGDEVPQAVIGIVRRLGYDARLRDEKPRTQT